MARKSKADEIKQELECIAAVKDSRGYISIIAQRLGVSQQHVYNLLDKYPSFKQARIEEQEKRKDRVELTLDKLVEGQWVTDPDTGRRVYIPPNPTAVIFYLKTQARDRGYSETVIQEHQGDLTICILKDRSADAD